MPHAATLLYRTAYRGTSDTTHYALEWETPTNFSANILRKKSAQALAPLLVAALSKTRRKILRGGGMEGIAECDGMPVCVVLTKQYWWAETPPFDMISPPSSADSELPPQNIHRILSPICSVSAINVAHLCHVHARKWRAKWPCNVTLMRMRSIGVITRTCLRNCELWS